MQSKDINFEISSLQKKMDEVIDKINSVKSIIRPEEELWDNADMIHHYKISSRTLSEWRSKELIRYIQVGSKIWYTLEAREAFNEKYSVKIKEKDNEKNGR